MASKTSDSWTRECGTVVVVAAVFVGSLGAAQTQPISRNFERNAPAIGDAMPDVAVRDRDGAELRLRDVLSGHYTVLILGCLT